MRTPTVLPFPFRKLRERIADMGLTRKAVADRAGMSLSTINKICQGQIVGTTHETIWRLSSALGVEPAWFFTLDLPEEASRGFGPQGVRL